MSICLTMIVRNEAHIIRETLASVLPYIDDYVIVDTGSTDATRRCISDFFAAHGIAGRVFERPWRDFGFNRSEALALARQHSLSAYLWMIDADDLLSGKPNLHDLSHDAYHLRFGPRFEYWRLQLFRRTLPWRYVGVLHEYAVCDEPPASLGRVHGRYHVDSRRLGARSRDPEKYARDAEVLQNALRSEPENERHVFYLAQSYFDAREFVLAYETYQRRATMGGWEQEVFYSRLRIAQCLEQLGAPFDDVQAAFLECFAQHPSRAEPIHFAAVRERSRCNFACAHEYATRASAVPRPQPDALFVFTDVYDYRALDEQAINAFYVNRPEETFRINCDLLARSGIPEGERKRLERNRDYAVPLVMDATLRYDAAIVKRISARQRAAEAAVTLSVTTCKRLDLFVKTITSFLNTCLDLHRIDRWLCVDDNSSAADRHEMQQRFPFFEFIWKDRGDKGHARSMNIIRDQVRTPFLLHLEDDWHFFQPRAFIEPAMQILNHTADIGQVLFNRNYAEVLDDRVLAGGHLVTSDDVGLRYVVHEHYPADSDAYRRFLDAHPGRRSCAYWPHYSLRPSLLRSSVLQAVGPYNEHAPHFELEYAERYVQAGFRSAFFDGISSLHIGRLTSAEANSGPPNAYALNQTVQFGDAQPIRIKLLASWCSSEEICRLWDKMSRGGGRWGRIEVTADDRDVDFYAVINAPPVGARFVPGRTIVFHMEPSAGIAALPGEWRDPDPSDFLHVRDHRHFPNPCEWHLGKTWEELHRTPIEKTMVLSTVTSSRYQDPGQKKRVDFIKYLQERQVAIDVYGRTNEHGFTSYRGALPPFEKERGLFPYRYTFAAENHAETNYFTEKLVDAILSECLCFYWGCPNVSDYIDPQAFVRVDLDDFEAAAQTIRETIEAREWERRVDVIRREKRKILDQLQFFPTLERIATDARGALLRRARRLQEEGRDAIAVRAAYADAFREDSTRVAPQLSPPDVVVINLDRRPDRLERFRAGVTAAGLHTFRRFAAIDGHQLRWTGEIRRLFGGNDFGDRRAVIGCALSHLGVWRDVQRETLVLEDDAEPCDSFLPRLHSVIRQARRLDAGWDLILLGYSPWSAYYAEPPRISGPPTLAVMRWEDYLGGLFAYLVSQRGAAKLLAAVSAKGVRCGIDRFLMRDVGDLTAYVAQPCIVFSPCARSGAGCDSDIQYDSTPLGEPEDGDSVA